MRIRFVRRRDFNFAKYDTPAREVRDPASIAWQPLAARGKGKRKEKKKGKKEEKRRRGRAQSLKLLPDGGEPFVKHAASCRGRSFLPFGASSSRGAESRDDAFNKPLLPPTARSLHIIASCSTCRTSLRARARTECPIGFIVIYPAEVTFHYFLLPDRRPRRDEKTASSLRRQTGAIARARAHYSREDDR